jgi:hypothetical protein
MQVFYVVSNVTRISTVSIELTGVPGKLLGDAEAHRIIEMKVEPNGVGTASVTASEFQRGEYAARVTRNTQSGGGDVALVETTVFLGGTRDTFYYTELERSRQRRQDRKRNELGRLELILQSLEAGLDRTSALLRSVTPQMKPAARNQALNHAKEVLSSFRASLAKARKDATPGPEQWLNPNLFGFVWQTVEVLEGACTSVEQSFPKTKQALWAPPADAFSTGETSLAKLKDAVDAAKVEGDGPTSPRPGPSSSK